MPKLYDSELKITVPPVQIVDGSGNQITSFGGGTQYTEGDTDSTITGTAVMWEDGADTLVASSVAKPLPVRIGDGTTLAEIIPLTNYNALAVGIVDSTGAQIAFSAPTELSATTTDADTVALGNGDSIHSTILSFANAVAASGGTGTITKMMLIDADDQGVAGELWLFKQSVTVPAKNAAWSLSDADLALCVGVIPFGPYFDATNGQISVNSSVRLPYICAATTLYGHLVTRGTPTYTATGLTVKLFVVKD